MNDDVSLQIYIENRTVISISVIERFSWKTVTAYIALILTLSRNRIPHQITLPLRILPFNRIPLIRKYNDIYLKNILYSLTGKFPPIYALWFSNPSVYTLHNYLPWKILVFDHHKQRHETHHFYKSVFSKHLVFVYKKNVRTGDTTVACVRKDAAEKYVAKIQRYIRYTKPIRLNPEKIIHATS